MSQDGRRVNVRSRKKKQSIFSFLMTLSFPSDQDVFELFSCPKCEWVMEYGTRRLDSVPVDGSAFVTLGKLSEFERSRIKWVSYREYQTGSISCQYRNFEGSSMLSCWLQGCQTIEDTSMCSLGKGCRRSASSKSLRFSKRIKKLSSNRPQFVDSSLQYSSSILHQHEVQMKLEAPTAKILI